MTEKQRQVYEIVVSKFGTEDTTAPFTRIWEENDYNIVLNLWVDGTARVSRYGYSQCGYGDWESFESLAKLRALLAQVTPR